MRWQQFIDFYLECFVTIQVSERFVNLFLNITLIFGLLQSIRLAATNILHKVDDLRVFVLMPYLVQLKLVEALIAVKTFIEFFS